MHVLRVLADVLGANSRIAPDMHATNSALVSSFLALLQADVSQDALRHAVQGQNLIHSA